MEVRSILFAVLISPEMNVIRNDDWRRVSRRQMSFRASAAVAAAAAAAA